MKEKKVTSKIVTKSNDLVEARYKLTASEQKLIIWLMGEIEPNDVDFKVYRMQINDFMKMLEVENKGTYKQVRQITLNMMEKVLEIRKSNGLLQISWFSSAEYKDGEGYVELCFDPKLKPLLLGLKEKFLSYPISNILQLKSAYSIRLYELLKQYQKIGKRIISIQDMRDMLGMSHSDYGLYADFKRRVIITAQKEIHKNTDISFTFEEIKEGRKVVYLVFTIISKHQQRLIDFNPSEKSKTKHKQKISNVHLLPINEIKKDKNGNIDMKDILPSLPPEHQNKKTIIDAITIALKKHGADYVISNIKYTNTHSQSNYRKYLIDALAKDYACGMREDIEEKKQRAIAGKKRLKERKQEVIVGNDLYEKALQYIQTLSKEELTALEEEVLKNQPEDYRDRFKRGEMFAVKGVQHAIEGIIYERMLAEEKMK
ncbi:MAG: replication initiation protein [Nitrospirae bacterium]|nr:replication initiation protein [Nitrospirota bacterium]